MDTEENSDEIEESTEGSVQANKVTPKADFWTASNWKPEKSYSVVLARRLIQEMPDHWPSKLNFVLDPV